MSKQMKIGLVVAALLAAAVVVGMETYIEHIKDDAETKAKIAIQQAKIDAAQLRVGEIQKDLDTKNGELEKEKAKIKTPAQAQKAISDYTPLHDTEVLPEAPSATEAAEQKSVLTLDDAKKLTEFAITCRQCANARDAAQATIEQKDTEIAAAKQQRDDAISNANGGSRWKRFRKGLKVIGCASAGGGLGALVKGGQGGAVGAFAGATLCSLF
jgi:hypothetical protein